MEHERLSWARAAFLSVLLACVFAVFLGTPGAFALDQNTAVEEAPYDVGASASSPVIGALRSDKTVEMSDAAFDDTTVLQDSTDVSQV